MSSTAIVVSDTSRSAPALLRSKWSRMSGSSTANAARSSSSTAFRPKRTISGKVGAPSVTAEGRHSSHPPPQPPEHAASYSPAAAAHQGRRLQSRMRNQAAKATSATPNSGRATASGDALADAGCRRATRGGARGRTPGRWSSRRGRATCARAASGSMRAPAATMLVPAARAAVRPSSRMNIGTRSTPPLLARSPLSTPMAKAGTTTSAARSRQRGRPVGVVGGVREQHPSADDEEEHAASRRAAPDRSASSSQRAEHRAGDATGHDQPGEAGVEVAGAHLAAGREHRRRAAAPAAAWRRRWRRARRRGPASAWRRRRHRRRRARTPCRRRHRRAGSADRARPDHTATGSQKSKTCSC